MVVDISAEKEQQERIVDQIEEIASKNKQLEKINQLFVGREVRMAELKQIINDLREEIAQLSGRKPR